MFLVVFFFEMGNTERKVLRRIFCPTKDRGGTWRRKTKDELKKIITYLLTYSMVQSPS